MPHLDRRRAVDRLCQMSADSIRFLEAKAVIWNGQTGTPAIVILRANADEALALSTWVDVIRVADQVLVTDHAVLSALIVQPLLLWTSVMGDRPDESATQFEESGSPPEPLPGDIERQYVLRLSEPADQDLSIPGYRWVTRAKDSTSTERSVIPFNRHRSAGRTNTDAP